MRIIAVGTLKAYYLKHPDTETGVKVWIQKVKQAEWQKPSDVVNSLRTARPIPNSRVIFSINGNDHRLIAQINYERQVVFVCFIGTHSEYDKIDPLTVWNY